ncbi:protein phosphatase [Streptomyces sp. IMTB 2501]|uniref:SpoIIE family protein phosphatase n=1 Tax=Streptomyces sp. IMTB 2501 TaxID=1776340 RepID=UPI00096C50BB|nr:SpoIIE family protein phosphatase [Streptomyces sp. IMTB 2501]OLZ74172.1 protein phosphatase [Streptomyces sp. IMTB 2501]
MADRAGVGIAGDAGAVMLDALFTQSPVGLAVLDTELRVVRVNTATPAMRGMREEDVVGRRFPRSHYVVEEETAEGLVREVLDTGVPARGHILRARPPAHSGRERLYEVSVFRLNNPRGGVLGAAITVVDVTERERVRNRLGILDAVHERVGRTMDVVVTCQELAEVLVPAFADVAVVEVVDSVIRGEDPPPSPLPRGVPLRHTAFRSVVGGQPEAQSVGDVRSLPAPTPFSQALADLLPRAVALDSGLPWLATDPARVWPIHDSGAHTLLAVPLALRGTVLGLLSLYRSRSPSPYDEDDVALARDVARHTALCIDNARRYTRDHTVAATVLHRMLPLRPASHTALDAAVTARPGDGGAWYDTIALSSARTALVAGAVSGRGIHAMATMGQLRTAVRSLAALDLDPEDLLARLNDTATFLAAERASLPFPDLRHRKPGTASCAYAVYDPLSLTCTVAAAGHPAPVAVRPDGTVAHVGTTTGPQLGSTDQSPFAATRIQLPHGSVIAFPDTVGLAARLSDAESPLRTAPAYADRPLQDLCDDIQYSLTADTETDGAVLLLARTRPFPADRVATWPLDHEPTAAATARECVSGQLAAWNVGEEPASNTELIVSELVTNAVRYGSPPLELRLILDRALTCEVSDCAATAPRLRHARTTDEGGRGLFIVAQLAQAWGARYSADGKTIWTEQTLAPP